ncbi:monocarboxylate 2-oxoacid-binding periplasmic protein precursor [Variibacter gotjawalensis]|uniref:Monocarboxylate 2-oxoacid-binding periplasmic protein n=1 Tax=Variibacter gotjawalensis TaxID=1333996 RepID=A0A0S3PSA3_9BRAD|nr:TRAP transporter substrate-binding protein [Variibacter gotjawalensis]NIK49098.1 TRAP-type mannitol/chloroaromatic compound transport system substrate-binding protein [Variibacter gotjawalensis]RZS50954.1 TRAP-type mannitol/chloroaromatic compound transport system substrate-binding protein [Variibacter gotjawalensis]BAT58788.1 monocarboxylate 2-oxoacid-binding periplasmic protein precursor [Variibacter gotjawalensis]
MTTRALAALGAILLAFGLGGTAEAQTTKLRFQSSFPPSGMFQENAVFFTERVKALSGGKLEIEMMPVGSVVPAFEVLDATHKKVIDGAHSATAYWLGRNRAATLFGPAPGGPFGMDTLDYLGWVNDGGGAELFREFYQDVLKRNIVPIPLTVASPQALGWFKNPVKNWDDLKGRKCRQTGITAEVFSKSGMATVNLPGAEIIPSAERGVIDCAEWVGPAEDMQIGFQTVWKNFYVTSTHEPATTLEMLINGDVWKALPKEHQEIIKTAAFEASLRAYLNMNLRNANAVKELREKHGVNVQRTPEDILKKTLEVWDQISKDEEAKNPFFKKVLESQRSYASKVVPTKRYTHPEYKLSADHYWPEAK